MRCSAGVEEDSQQGRDQDEIHDAALDFFLACSRRASHSFILTLSSSESFDFFDLDDAFAAVFVPLDDPGVCRAEEPVSASGVRPPI